MPKAQIDTIEQANHSKILKLQANKPDRIQSLELSCGKSVKSIEKTLFKVQSEFEDKWNNHSNAVSLFQTIISQGK